MSIFDVAVWDEAEHCARMLDQRRLPNEVVNLYYRSAAEMADGIRDMVVRGAPAIGCACAYGVAVEAKRLAKQGIPSHWPTAMAEGMATLRQSRPTAVNLTWALERMAPLLETTPPHEVPQRLLQEAHAIREEDIASCRAMGAHGAALLPTNSQRPTVIMTHCNAGALATAGYGTALGVIRAAHTAQQGNLRVIANETRPYLQGARLTAWELLQDHIDTTLITDNMAGWLMANGEVDAVVVGSDRVAANGDVANKIGTYTLAVLARRHDIPFFVAAPLSTVDLRCPTGREIPIEERSANEVTHCMGIRSAADGVKVRNPAFDVTPAELITAFICEKGVAKAPDQEKIAKLFQI
ncbi:methylthioribose-1-phosphate isomerase [Magnetococcus marinus MC-1]|uniref:Methylthioribose-1-phosphate isomerase n=1 Tax=Magnetococcus marinus (strain ATCC BAA-1437 / JCM 17883 / MC-1) TaxID=156889 RepID=MTNA_MAGMM|nr:S-methyl-5-thioribose-1-phosphate isomerase [Magnetococcus marinus]A0L909.1 RecName: Full=Methylthioribose-1-phosphate isomerase; Short=M1Pi; Short=MTR-1-P isomerase; AltName: Full=S-methyl-5-thioribose-1-phosphate isomerase [Magnetococcus marinus MC-1]ABK44452.1 methylthioribose-1-phosphate isomerase [Magnetococcus marinus MC-1]